MFYGSAIHGGYSLVVKLLLVEQVSRVRFSLVAPRYTSSMTLYGLDKKIIAFFQRVSTPTARFSLFIIFFWFGFLKVIGQSPASGVVE